MFDFDLENLLRNVTFRRVISVYRVPMSMPPIHRLNYMHAQLLICCSASFSLGSFFAFNLKQRSFFFHVVLNFALMFHSLQLNKQKFYTIISIIWLGIDSIGMFNVHRLAKECLFICSKQNRKTNKQSNDLKQREVSKGSQIGWIY